MTELDKAIDALGEAKDRIYDLEEECSRLRSLLLEANAIIQNDNEIFAGLNLKITELKRELNK
jgi:uncharacterized protein YicC (UPF0701 family)